jgi:stage V sporulation protein R
MTKIMNEGWASYWHAELFHLYEGVSPDEMIEFAALHAGVVNPGGRFSVNPYYLGYTILVDIEKRWDKMREEWSEDPRERERLRREKHLYVPDTRPMTGREKIFEVRRTEDDISFLRNYLTTKLVKDLGLFAYGSDCTHPPGEKCQHCENVVLTSRERDAVVESLLTPRYNYGMPRIVVTDVANQTLRLEHLDRTTTFLDRRFANQTLAYIAEVWKHPVHLLTSDEHGKDTALSTEPK